MLPYKGKSVLEQGFVDSSWSPQSRLSWNYSWHLASYILFFFELLLFIPCNAGLPPDCQCHFCDNSLHAARWYLSDCSAIIMSEHVCPCCMWIRLCAMSPGPESQTHCGFPVWHWSWLREKGQISASEWNIWCLFPSWLCVKYWQWSQPAWVFFFFNSTIYHPWPGKDFTSGSLDVLIWRMGITYPPMFAVGDKMIHSTVQKRNRTSWMAPGRYVVIVGYGKCPDVEYSSALMSFLLHSRGGLQFLRPRVPPLLTKCLCARELSREPWKSASFRTLGSTARVQKRPKWVLIISQVKDRTLLSRWLSPSALTPSRQRLK